MVTLDSENKPYCTKVVLNCTHRDAELKPQFHANFTRRLFLLQDYTKKFSAVCAGCKKAITPKQGQVVQKIK